MKYKLIDLCDIQIGRTPPRKEFQWFNTGATNDFTWVSIKDLGDCNKYINSSSETISCVGQKKFNIPIVKAGTILLSFKLTVGRVAIATKDLLTNEAIAQLPIKDPSKVDRDFLYYYLLKFPWSTLGSTSSIATAINSKIIKEMEVELPDTITQRKIANILSILDEKINNNKAINDNLSYQIQTIFLNMFDFSSDEYKQTNIGSLPIYITDYVANGSFASLKDNVTLLDAPDYAYFIRNTDLKSGKFNVYVNKHSYDFLNKSALFGDEIIISNVGDIGSVFLCPTLDKPMTLGNNVIMIKPLMIEYKYFLYCWFKWFDGQKRIQGIKGGSAVPKFNKTEFKSISINLPPLDLLNKFHKLVEALFMKINQLSEENKVLSQILISILPKLMDGSIDVTSISID